MRINALTPAILCGATIEAGLLYYAFQNDWPIQIPLFIILYGALYLLCLAAWKSPLIPLPAVLGFALLFRLTLLPTIPTLSDDVYRYGWEGRIARQGHSPFRHPPEAPELAHLRDASWSLINHKNISTVYPTFSQLAFRCGTYLTDALRHTGPVCWRSSERWQIWTDVVGQKSVFVFFDLLTLLGIWMLMRHHGVDPRNIILYAWNPLVLLEIAASGHLDSLGISMLILGVLAWEKGRWVLSGLALAASFLSKYMSALLIPKMLLQANGPLLGAWGALALIGLVVIRPPVILLKGPTTYAVNWQFNGSLYALLQPLLGGNGVYAKWTTAALGFGAMGWISMGTAGITQTAYRSIAVALLLAPTLHPWYFLWLLPFLCIYPNPAFLLWNGTIALSYTVLTQYRLTQVWGLQPWVQWLEYAPVYLWLAWRVRNTCRIQPHQYGLVGQKPI